MKKRCFVIKFEIFSSLHVADRTSYRVLYLDLITLTILLPRNGPADLLCYERRHSLTAFKGTSRVSPPPDTSRVSGVLGRARHTSRDLQHGESAPRCENTFLRGHSTDRNTILYGSRLDIYTSRKQTGEVLAKFRLFQAWSENRSGLQVKDTISRWRWKVHEYKVSRWVKRNRFSLLNSNDDLPMFRNKMGKQRNWTLKALPARANNLRSKGAKGFIVEKNLRRRIAWSKNEKCSIGKSHRPGCLIIFPKRNFSDLVTLTHMEKLIFCQPKDTTDEMYGRIAFTIDDEGRRESSWLCTRVWATSRTSQPRPLNLSHGMNPEFRQQLVVDGHGIRER